MLSGTVSSGLAAGGVSAAPDRLPHRPKAAYIGGGFWKRIVTTSDRIQEHFTSCSIFAPATHRDTQDEQSRSDTRFVIFIVLSGGFRARRHAIWAEALDGP